MNPNEQSSKFAPGTTRFKAGDQFFWYDQEGNRMNETVLKVVTKGHPGDNELWVTEGMGWIPEHMAKPIEPRKPE